MSTISPSPPTSALKSPPTLSLETSVLVGKEKVCSTVEAKNVRASEEPCRECHTKHSSNPALCNTPRSMRCSHEAAQAGSEDNGPSPQVLPSTCYSEMYSDANQASCLVVLEGHYRHETVKFPLKSIHSGGYHHIP